MKRHIWGCALSAALLIWSSSLAHAVNLGPTPYLKSDDSPFAGQIGQPGFYLETFEDGKLDTLGVTEIKGGTVISPSSITDSVDADDFSIDGFGKDGHSFFGSGTTGFDFYFDPVALGGYPTVVGIVWTDGANSIKFEAFDQNGASLGAIFGNDANNSVSGETLEDRFFGATNAGGISHFTIQSGLVDNGGGIEVDHLQYNSGAGEVPEPASLSLLAIGALALLHRRR